MARHGRRWTRIEDYALMAHCHQMTAATMARRLGRTEHAVRRRMMRLRLSVTRDGVVTSGEAARLTGLSPQYLTRLARQGRIPARRKPGGRWWCFSRVDLLDLLDVTTMRT